VKAGYRLSGYGRNVIRSSTWARDSARPRLLRGNLSDSSIWSIGYLQGHGEKNCSRSMLLPWPTSMNGSVPKRSGALHRPGQGYIHRPHRCAYCSLICMEQISEEDLRGREKAMKR
jgi:hypothetical protein